MTRILLPVAALVSSLLASISPAAQAHTLSAPRVLFILSAHEHGYWLPEVLTPYKILTDAGFDVTFATPEGHPGVQAGGDMMNDEERRTLGTLSDILATPAKLSDIDPADYLALYVPGGAGPMFDLFDHPQVNRIAASMYENDKPVTAACHGPAALAAVRLSNGKLLVEGKRLTAKSNAEEGDWARANYPFLLEDKLKAVSSQFSAAAPYQPWVVRDGNLLTGQNPASAGPLARSLLKILAAGHDARTD